MFDLSTFPTSHLQSSCPLIPGTYWLVCLLFKLISTTFLQVISWGESPTVLIQGNIETTDLKYPAVTLCSKVSTRYGIAERLGNYIDPLNLPTAFLSIRHDYFMCAIGFLMKDRYCTPKKCYQNYCINNRVGSCKV